MENNLTQWLLTGTKNWATRKEQTAETFIPTRYPYTYAYDFLRQHYDCFGLMPTNDEGYPLSRGDCAGIVRKLVEKTHKNKEDQEKAKENICRYLADLYIIENGIKKR